MRPTNASSARAHGLICGTMQPGPRNLITDVAGITVGHKTIIDGDLRTGFTAIVPHPGNLFLDKLVASSDVINGFGKSAGLIQVEELGTLETPILLTNTFGVAEGIHALIRRELKQNPQIDRAKGTVNPVVMECNDGYLSDINAIALTEEDANAALSVAATDFEQGSVGAGTGISCFGFKGGIGSASRQFKLDGKTFTLGALVQANFGRAGDLVLPDGRRPSPEGMAAPEERGSVIVVLATDVPLESRQLKRIARRAGAGLARLGSFYGNGSGDIGFAFSTAHKIPHNPEGDLIARDHMHEGKIDLLFQAAAETTQEAVLNAMIASPAMYGKGTSFRPSLKDWLDQN
ncbi:MULTISPECIES: P1 family peptidase [unclassified Roseibium]|uniref:DmpA family aminopeptidase n=1 Tax=unclassified Roseibium TaxID=2629323 RepID=UPI00273DDB68|nr:MULTISPECIES: P1 family peptidase [unclassified Roseibium]